MTTRRHPGHAAPRSIDPIGDRITGRMVDVADQLRRQALPIEELRKQVRRQRFQPLSSANLDDMPWIAPPRPSLRLVENRRVAV